MTSSARYWWIMVSNVCVDVWLDGNNTGKEYESNKGKLILIMWIMRSPVEFSTVVTTIFVFMWSGKETWRFKLDVSLEKK